MDQWFNTISLQNLMGWWDDDWGDDWYDFGSLVVWTTDDSHHPHQSWMVLDSKSRCRKGPILWVPPLQFLSHSHGGVTQGDGNLRHGKSEEALAIRWGPWNHVYIYNIYIHMYHIIYIYIYMYHICIICCICITYIIYVSHILYYITYICISITHIIYVYTYFDCYYYPSLPLLRLSWLSISWLLSLL